MILLDDLRAYLYAYVITIGSVGCVDDHLEICV